MIGATDIFQLSPGFQQAVVGVHDALLGVALVVCFGGLVMVVTQAQRERHIGEIMPALIRITLISLLLANLGDISNWLGDLVTDIEQAAGVNGNPMQAFTNAIQAKFGVDPAATFGTISPNGQANAAPGTILTHYAYPGDSTPDSLSAQGIGAFNSTPGSLVALQSAALTTSAAQQYGVSPGQSFSITSGGQTYNLVYADHAPESDSRVDIYDPNGVLPGGNNFSGTVDSFTPGAAAGGNNPVGGFFNTLLHPVETAQMAALGMFTLVLSYVAAFIQWLVAVAQSILLYSEIALAPIFVGFLMVRGYEVVAKTFILSFIAISMWRLAFLVVGLITQMLLGLAANTASQPGSGLLWFICVSLWVIFGSIVGPWWISRAFVRGASGVADLIVGAGASGVRAVQIGGSTAAAAGNAPGAMVSRVSTGGSRRFP